MNMTGSETRKVPTGDRCDVKVWSGACEHDSYGNPGEKYLCDSCGRISRLDHEISHEGFIHLKGDEDYLC
jgi:hypothetical protein